MSLENEHLRERERQREGEAERECELELALLQTLVPKKRKGKSINRM